jgi:hypothetical protein
MKHLILKEIYLRKEDTMAGFASNPQFDEAFRKKYELMQMKEDTDRADQLAKAPVYQAQAGYYAGHNPSQEKIAGMQYGVGGQGDRNALAQERINTMHYGPGGAIDRGIAAEHGSGGTWDRRIASSDRSTLAQSPAWEGEGALKQAQTSSLLQDLPINAEINKKILKDKFNPSGVAKPRKYADWYKPGQFTQPEQPVPTPGSMMWDQAKDLHKYWSNIWN